jgi:hypothetical protein
MTSWGIWYWRVFNVLVRALGLVAFLSGAVFTVLGAVRILQLGLLRTEGAPGLVTLSVGLLIAALGAGILGAPTYRPDQGDVPWRFDPFGKARLSSPSKRSWWTGDP